MAQDKFNAKADTTGLSSFLKKKISTWKNSTTNLGNWPEGADIRLKLLKVSSGPPCWLISKWPGFQIDWENDCGGKVLNILEDCKALVETRMWCMGLESRESGLECAKGRTLSTVCTLVNFTKHATFQDCHLFPYFVIFRERNNEVCVRAWPTSI